MADICFKFFDLGALHAVSFIEYDDISRHYLVP